MTISVALPAQAVSFTTTAGPLSTEPGAILFNNFDGVALPYGTFTGGSLNVAANPGGGGNWLTIDGVGTLALASGASYLGFLWGTTDSYNNVELFNGSTSLGVFTGQGGSGINVTSSQQNVFVNFFAGLGEQITGVKFSSGYALEMDNFSYKPAVAPVPVPAGLPLLAMGLGTLGFFGWRKKRANAPGAVAI